MKLGSIVGIIIAAVLCVSGIVLCIVGAVCASGDGNELFMQIDGDGTHYTQEITSDVTKLSLNCIDADIEFIGGADRSSIEFINFNPNKYSLSVTSNVITFNESSDISSLLDLGELTVSFKGLRYLLDFRNAGLDRLDKKIIVRLADDSRLKVVDIDADTCTLKADSLTLAGDILLDADDAVLDISDSAIASAFSITSSSLRGELASSTGSTLRVSADSCELYVDGCDFADCDIAVSSGRVDYISVLSLDSKRVSVSTTSGGLMINLKPATSPFTQEPTSQNTSGDSDDAESAANIFKIVSESASINLQFPTDDASSEVSSDAPTDAPSND